MCGNWLKICIGFYYFILEQSDDVDVKLDALFFSILFPCGLSPEENSVFGSHLLIQLL